MLAGQTRHASGARCGSALPVSQNGFGVAAEDKLAARHEGGGDAMVSVAATVVGTGLQAANSTALFPTPAAAHALAAGLQCGVVPAAASDAAVNEVAVSD